eukprot:TRINITY_DN17514_c0_g1_i1.p1 TRINITY_DN17514_c0_g1~~TRINITY_DN17514_c0_g1_i1.p1  ORF type:complete len:145 (+),score=24.12 TRINITY_DN17514_c0_g1_i1:64-498(+)
MSSTESLVNPITLSRLIQNISEGEAAKAHGVAHAQLSTTAMQVIESDASLFMHKVADLACRLAQHRAKDRREEVVLTGQDINLALETLYGISVSYPKGEVFTGPEEGPILALAVAGATVAALTAETRRLTPPPKRRRGMLVAAT